MFPLCFVRGLAAWIWQFAPLAVAAIVAASGSGAEVPRPNVVLLVADDLRPDAIAALGNPHIKTPHLDELARRGTVFTRATCAHPLCYPSRAELLTGCTGFRNGSYSGLSLKQGVPLWPQVMRSAGYRTCYVGKWHTAGRPSGVGYDECDGLYAGGKESDEPYLDFRGRPATGYRGWQFQTDGGQRFPAKGIGLTPGISAEFADAAIRQLERQTDRPFFLHVNFTAPHDPRIWPPGQEGQSDGAKLPLPKSFRAEHPFDHGNLRGRDEQLLPFPRTADDVRQELACYYAVVSHLDTQIGRILAALKAADSDEDTLVIFTSDHGLALGSHGLVGKQNMYEHTINVPLVIAGPKIPAGQQVAAQWYLRDLFPTVCEMAGIEVPPIDGRSVVPVLQGKQAEVHPFVVGYFQDAQRMIREGRWKLIWYPKIDRWQLFDLEADPDELNDLSTQSDQATRIAGLRGKLLKWLQEQGDSLAK